MDWKKIFKESLPSLEATWENAQMWFLENIRGLGQDHELIKGTNLLVTWMALLCSQSILCAGITLFLADTSTFSSSCLLCLCHESGFLCNASLILVLVIRAEITVAHLTGCKGPGDICKPLKYLWQREPRQLLQLPGPFPRVAQGATFSCTNESVILATDGQTGSSQF